MKIMYDIPVQTHIFYEPITEKPHARTILIKNFLRFGELVMWSNKEALKSVFLNIRENVKSYTGHNLRRIMILMEKNNIRELESFEVK